MVFMPPALVINQLGEPNDPFKVISGDVNDYTYFDISLAREIHQRA